MPHTRKSTYEDCFDLADTLRDVDRREVALLGGGGNAMDALWAGVHPGPATTIVSDDGVVLAMFGVKASGLPGVGFAWMLTSVAFEKDKVAKRRVLKESPEAILSMHKDYPVLTNVILKENRLAIKWLRWLGFKFQPVAHPDILLFTRETSSCASPQL